jgi:hypothetical protein
MAEPVAVQVGELLKRRHPQEEPLSVAGDRGSGVVRVDGVDDGQEDAVHPAERHVTDGGEDGAAPSRGGHLMELHEATITGPLDAAPWTMRFANPTAELDYVRFSTRASRPAKTVALMLVLAAAFVSVAVEEALDSVDVRSVLIAACLVAALGTATYAATFLTCRRAFATVAAEAAAFVRLELATALTLVCIVGGLLVIDAWRDTVAPRPLCDERRPDVVPCRDSLEDYLYTISVCGMVIAPRMHLMLLVTAVVAVGSAAVMFALELFPAPIFYVNGCIICAIYAVALCAFTAGVESSWREHFRAFVRIAVAKRRQVEATAVCMAVLNSALPPELLGDASARKAHTSDDAAVCVTVVHNFLEWSTHLLPPDVVQVLHMLLTTFELGLDAHPGVVRAMTYGDSFVTCAGLLSPVDSAFAALSDFAAAQLRAARMLNTHFTGPDFSLRISICGGSLAGGVVGDGASRFVVVGPAFDAAMANLAVATPDVVYTATVARSRPPTVIPSLHTGSSPLDAAPIHGEQSVTASTSDSDGSATLEFSAVLLTFHGDGMQRGMDAANNRHDVESVFTALAPVVVSLGYLLVFGLEQGQADDWRRRHDNDYVSFVLLPVAVAASALHLVIRARPLGVPSLLLDYGVVALAFAALTAAMVFGSCQFVRPRVSWINCAFMTHFRRLQWMQQVALQLALVVLPATYWRLALYPFASVVAEVVYFGLEVVFVIIVYVNVRNKLLRHAADVVAARALRLADATLAESGALLNGALPAHAVPGVWLPSAAARDDPLPDVRFSVHREMCSLHVVLRPAGGAGSQFAVVAEVWGGLAALLARATAALLEIVEATGDAFLVAGPFGDAREALVGDAADAVRHRAATTAVDFLRELARLLGDKRCTFTAVAAAGAGTGTLMGAALLSYRLLGPAVREGNLLLAAAPAPLTPASLAFASDAFVRQYRNFRLARMPAAALQEAEPGMSLPIGASFFAGVQPTASSDGVLRLPQPFGGHGLRRDVSTPAASDPFRGHALWRVRGVGAATVHTIAL